MALVATAWAQVDTEIPLYEREPFDRITLDAANKSAVVEIYPLQDIDRTTSVLAQNKSLYTIRRLDDPVDRLFRVSRRNVVKFELFHELLLDAASNHISAKEVDAAFPYLARLVNDYPDTENLEAVVEEFYFADARHLFERGRYDESLISLDEVFQRSPNRPGLNRVLDRVLGEILRIEFRERRFDSIQRKLRYARDRYADATKQLVARWEQRLADEATKQVNTAQTAFAEGDAIAALSASRLALAIWPDSAEAKALHREILAKYPRVRVGVSQRYTQTAEDARNPLILNWAARRSQPLLRRHIVEFDQFTSEGGVYRCPIGKLTVAPDRTLVSLSLQSGSGAYELCRTLLGVADPQDESYSARWAEYLAHIFVANPGTLEIQLTRPTLRPETLIPRSFPSTPTLDAALEGGFLVQPGGSPDEVNYRRRQTDDAGEQRVTQIVERYYEDATAMTQALIAGELDVIDRVHPADLGRLRAQPNVVVAPYQIPTVHFLVFNDRDPIWRSSTFRRGILYGIRRAGFLEQLGATSTSRVLSAPLPAGKTSDDPLGYAYNRQIVPREQDPSLAQVLLRLSRMQQELLKKPTNPAAPQGAETDAPDKAAATPPEPTLPTLVLAHPESPIARAASASIAFDLRRIGFKVTLRSLPAGSIPRDGEWDMLYVEASVEEPLVDFPRLILGESLLGRHGGLVWQATRTLQEATDLAQVREQFAKIHKLSFDHTPLIPLWQMVEHVAYRKEIQGLATSPASLYENISDWRFAP